MRGSLSGIPGRIGHAVDMGASSAGTSIPGMAYIETKLATRPLHFLFALLAHIEEIFIPLPSMLSGVRKIPTKTGVATRNKWAP